jgi:hypothetical protein
VDGGLTSFVAVSFLDTRSGFGLVPAAPAPVLAEWPRNLHVRCNDLRGGAIPATAWQDEVSALLGRVAF